MISVGMLRDVWGFRGLILGSIKPEFETRWQGTPFGPIWIAADPLTKLLIFSVIFANIMRPSLPAQASAFAYSAVQEWAL